MRLFGTSFHHRASWRRASSPETPTMNVYLTPCLQALVDFVQDGFHQLRCRQAVISDGETVIAGIPLIDPGLLLQQVLVRYIFAFPGEIDECIDAGFEKSVESPARLFRVIATRVFACQEAARLHPVGFRNGEMVITHWFAKEHHPSMLRRRYSSNSGKARCHGNMRPTSTPC